MLKNNPTHCHFWSQGLLGSFQLTGMKIFKYQRIPMNADDLLCYIYNFYTILFWFQEYGGYSSSYNGQQAAAVASYYAAAAVAASQNYSPYLSPNPPPYQSSATPLSGKLYGLRIITFCIAIFNNELMLFQTVP